MTDIYFSCLKVKLKKTLLLSKIMPFLNALAIANLNLLEVFDMPKNLFNETDVGTVKIVEVI